MCISVPDDLAQLTDHGGFAHMQEVAIPSMCHKAQFPKAGGETLGKFFAGCDGMKDR